MGANSVNMRKKLVNLKTLLQPILRQKNIKIGKRKKRID